MIVIYICLNFLCNLDTFCFNTKWAYLQIYGNSPVYYLIDLVLCMYNFPQLF